MTLTGDRDAVRYALAGPDTQDEAEAFGRIEDEIARLRGMLEGIKIAAKNKRPHELLCYMINAALKQN